MTNKALKFYQLEMFARRLLRKKRGKITKHDMLKCYLKELRRYRTLTKEEELALTRKIGTEDDTAAKEQLICANLRFVARLTRRFQNRGLDIVELIDAGNQGLIHAVEKFDYRKGYRFNTYSIWWIKRAIHEALEAYAGLVRMSALARRIKQENTKFLRKHGRKPSEVELAKILKEDAHKIAVAINELRAPYSTEELRECRDNLAEIIQNKLEGAENPCVDPLLYNIEGFDDLVAAPPDEMTIKQEESKRFWRAFDKLSIREKEVLRRNFGLNEYEPQTLQEISDILHVTRERVRQIKENALKHIRIILSSPKLKPRKRIFDMKRP